MSLFLHRSYCEPGCTGCDCQCHDRSKDVRNPFQGGPYTMPNPQERKIINPQHIPKE